MREIAFFVLVFLCFGTSASAQEFFYIKDFDISVQVNKDASLDIQEKISVHFTSPRYGIFRRIPYRYKIEDLPEGAEKADIGWVKKGYRYTEIDKIKVPGFDSKVYTEGDDKVIRIGSNDKLVDGDQIYTISYRIEGAVNFFPDFSELYLNLTGNGWPVTLENTHFKINFYKPVADTSQWFVATGRVGAMENMTRTHWINAATLEGNTTDLLNAYEGITIGVRMDGGYLTKPDYSMRGMGWVLLPILSFIGMFFTWKKWGKDDPVTVKAEYYPPEGVSPSVAGYIVDGKLDRRDMTALVPFWGAGGYLKVQETEEKRLLGLIKDKGYEFTKLKDLPPEAEDFERIMFDGMFAKGDVVSLDDLKDTFYKTMESAKQSLLAKIKTEDYYAKYTRTLSGILPVFGLIITILGIVNLLSDYPLSLIKWVSVILAGVALIVFGIPMEKKTKKGTVLYEHLLGFKEFIKTVERDKLNEFLKQDQNFFDKVLPFAIVFDVADQWKDRLKTLDVPPPSWYSGIYAGNAFNTMLFMNNLDKGMNAMSRSFYSRPSSSGSGFGGSTGGSFGGGGFSGGGFGGGGGGSW